MSDRVVVVGNPSSLFVQMPVRAWRRLGVDAVILTGRWPSDRVDGDLPVISAEALAPASVRAAGDAIAPLMVTLDAMINAYEPARVREALKTWGPEREAPSLAPPVRDGMLIAAALDVIQPAAVLGHEVFAYGLATSVAPAARRSLFVWGADVLHSAWTSDGAFTMVRNALQAVDNVMTCAESMRQALHARFDVPPERLALVTYGVDRQQFRRRSAAEDARVRAAFDIPPGARLVMNLRRFLPHWGAASAAEVMTTLVERRADVHLVVLEGADGSLELRQFLTSLGDRGLRHRVTAIPGHAPLSMVAELMGISDVSLSLVDSLEPFSLSVLQAAAAGSALVVADQDTYRAERDRGLAVSLVPPRQPAAAADAVLAHLDAPDAGRAAAEANARFTAAHYDQDQAMLRQLRIVAGNAFVRRVLGVPVE